MSDNVCEAFAKLCDLCIALDAAPANKHEGCWERRLDQHWEIAFNGHKELKMCSHGVAVEPFHCYVQYNGWPAGVFTPYGGCIAAGECANETTFLAALTRAEAEALGCRLPNADDPDDYSITIGLADTTPGAGQYRCELCNGVFNRGWTNEEAKAEAESNGFDVSDCVLVCDDCYKTTPWGRM